METITFSRTEYDQYCGPVVYKIIGDQNEILYIGASMEGYKRIFTKSGSGCLSHDERRNRAFQQSTRIEVEFYKTSEEAIKREERLIHQWHPSGQMCKLCSVPSLDLKANGKKRSAEKETHHLQNATKLVSQFGGIPKEGWLRHNGYNALRVYMSYKRRHN